MFRSRSKLRTVVILLLLIIIGYWQVSLLIYGLKWDLIDVVLPFRYYFSECIHSGFFPFWDPYQQTGTPFYADLQAPTYYPELLITSLLGGYGVYTMHVLFIVYLLIASIGMYRLANYFHNSKNASLFAAISYVFCGYIVGHGQHFFLLVGSAWIPFVILSYIKLNQNPKNIDVIKTGCFLFLMLTGAYQALSIALFYLLILIFIYNIIYSVVIKNQKQALQILKANFFLSILVSILCLPLIISTLDIIHSVGRLEEGITLQKTLSNGQPFSTFLSFIVPFTTLKNSEFFGHNDASMINHYIGIIPLIFFIVSLFRKHSALEYLLLGFGLIIFLMSFNFLSLREIMYKHVPLMDRFLYSAYIRVFGLLGMILFAAGFFGYFEKNFEKSKKSVISVTSIFIIGLICLIIISFSNTSIQEFKQLFSVKSIESILNNMSFYQNMLVSAFINMLILSGFLIAIVFKKLNKYLTTISLVLLFGEVFFAAQLNMYRTVIDMQYNPCKMQKDLNLCPKGFPIPINDKIIFNNKQHSFFAPFWRNTYIFTKQISFDSFSSFELKTYSELDDTFPDFRNIILDNHLFYFSDTISSIKTFLSNSDSVNMLSKLLFFNDSDYAKLSEYEVKTDSTDSIKILVFNPNRVYVRTNTKYDQFFTMLQTNYPGWNAFIDNEKIPVYTSNFNYRTILLPKGEHLIRYEYKNNKILILYLISNGVFFICFLFLIGYWLKKKNTNKKTYLFVPLAVSGLLICLFLYNLVNGKRESVSIQDYYRARFNQNELVFKKELSFEENQSNYDSLNVFSGNKSFVVDSNIETVPFVRLEQKDRKIKKGTLVVSAKIYADNYSKAILASEINGKWHALKIEKQIEGLNRWNEILYLRSIPKMKEGEVLNVYLWNLNKSEFLLDDVSIKLYK